MKKLRRPKYIYFVYQSGVLDWVGVDIANAREMAIDSEDPYSRDNYQIERWVKGEDSSYVFNKVIQERKI